MDRIDEMCNHGNLYLRIDSGTALCCRYVVGMDLVQRIVKIV